MKGLLFDLDGTLLDSMHVWTRLADEYLEFLGVNPPMEIKKQIKTMTLIEALAYFKEQFGLEVEVEKMLSDVHDILANYYHTTIKVKPNVRETLNLLRQEGYPMAVSTATSENLSVPALTHHGLIDYFSFVQTVKNTGFPKAKKEFWLEGAKRLGIEPENIVVFEDALHAMESAKACGMRVIAIEDETARKDREKIRALADIYLTDFSVFQPSMVMEFSNK